jgi:hypothetical protein
MTGFGSADQAAGCAAGDPGATTFTVASGSPAASDHARTEAIARPFASIWVAGPKSMRGPSTIRISSVQSSDTIT